jgi:hypothetical protein
MRLFLIAFALTALATVSFAQDSRSGDGDTGWQPMRSSRFETSAAQEYLTRRARTESEHRSAMLRYYDSIGFNYGSPGINSGVFFNAPPPFRSRRVFWNSFSTTPIPYGW